MFEQCYLLPRVPSGRLLASLSVDPPCRHILGSAIPGNMDGMEGGSRTLNMKSSGGELTGGGDVPAGFVAAADKDRSRPKSQESLYLPAFRLGAKFKQDDMPRLT